MKFQERASTVVGELGKVFEKIDEKEMGCLFEQSLFILHDLMVLTLMEKMEITPSQMAKRHRNVE